ncbi:MAG TPA: hypothetical protein VM597_14950 [Gemmataceae bacterium]|nr:hypothetical protein [Gemmataceae bacterium]
MNRFCLAGAILAALTGTAAAQGPPRLGAPPPPPGYSPYLNLVRPGSPGANYYGLVRPQQYFQNSIQGLQMAGGGGGLSPVVGGLADGSDLPGTGLPVQFMNHRSYFMNLGGAGFGTAAGAGGRQGPAQGGGARPAPRGR